MLTLMQKTTQTKCEFCQKDFKSLGRHKWRCQARVINRENARETSILNNNVINNLPTLETSLVNHNGENNPSQLFNNDYDPHEDDKKDRCYRCYCGRVFNSLRGFNIHRRTCNIMDIPDIKSLLTAPSQNELNEPYNSEITIEHLPKMSTKLGTKLPQNTIEWDRANDYFKNNLNRDISDLNSAINSFHNTVYDYFSNTCGKINGNNTGLENKYKNLNKNQLKKTLTELKLTKAPTLEIKFVSRLLRNKFRKEEDPVFDHKSRYNDNFWKYCESIYDPEHEKITPNFDEKKCHAYFSKVFAKKTRQSSFDIPS